jgi:hypothetical protein
LIYFRDPSGDGMELAAKAAEHYRAIDPAVSGSACKLDR